MVRFILAVPKEKLDNLETEKLSVYERNTLQELCDILGPFEDATMYAQKGNTVSASLVLPCVGGLKNKMQVLSS